MKRFIVPVAFLAAVCLPLLALARPPLIYHRITRLAYHSGERLRIRLGMQNVVIKVKRGDSVSVESYLWADADSPRARKRIVHDLAPAVISTRNVVVIKSPRRETWHWSDDWGASLQAREVVTIPPAMAVGYRLGSGDFRFDNPKETNAIRGFSGSGDVVVRSRSLRLSIKVGSGNARVYLGGHPQTLSVITGSGNIDVVGGARRINLRAGSGNVKLRAGFARVASIKSGSGDIAARWSAVEPDGDVRVRTGSGDISMSFPKGMALAGQITTGSGEVNSAFSLSRQPGGHTYVLEGGQGAVQFYAETGSGDVSLSVTR